MGFVSSYITRCTIECIFSNFMLWNEFNMGRFIYIAELFPLNVFGELFTSSAKYVALSKVIFKSKNYLYFIA